MATSDPTDREREAVGARLPRLRATETEEAFKTTEFIAFLAVLIAILIAGLVADSLDPARVWLYATLLTIGYMVSRGLAKSGSQDPYTDE